MSCCALQLPVTAESSKRHVFQIRALFYGPVLLAFVMAELNIIHPFREGNGRAIREFIRELALHNGYLLNWGRADREAILQTAVASVDDYTALVPLLAQCME